MWRYEWWSRWYRLDSVEEVFCEQGCKERRWVVFDEDTELWVRELMCIDGKIGSVLPLIIGG